MAGVTQGAAGPASGPAERQMAAVASIAVAAATWFAAAAALLPAGGSTVALLVLGGLLAAGAGGGMRRRTVRVLPPGKDVLVLTVGTCAALLGLYLLDWLSRDQIGQVARLLPIAVAGLSIFWPEPNVLRFCVLLALGTLLGAPAPSRPALVLALAAMAVALVATNRLTAAAAPRLGGAPPVRTRRLSAEAAAVLVIVGLLAALAASLVPPPPGSGGSGGSDAGGGPGRLPQPAAPAVHFDDRLDVAGGRGEPGDEYVLLVGAAEPDVWRALTYDRWDGEVWSRSPEERAFVDYDIRPGVGDPEGDSGSPSFFQAVTVLARFADVLAAAPRPTRAEALATDLEQGADGSVYPIGPIPRGGRYIAFSDRAPASAADLRALGDTPARVLPLDVGSFYLQLPEVSPPIRTLAAELAAREVTTFDKAGAVEAWMDRNTTVTDDAAPVPAGADALEAFLLEDRAGPPERAATAMVVMLRAVGVPARLAVGYLPGRRDGPDEPFTVRASDVHAWVEVWFPTAGWQRFDPTGRAPDPRAEAESVWDRLLRFLERLWPVLAALVLAGAGWLAWRVAAWRRRRAALPWSTRYFARVERAGRARGRPRRPEETPREYARGLAASVLPDPRLKEAGELVTVAAWSLNQPSMEDRARAESVLKAAKKASPAPVLRRLRPLRLRRGRRPRPTIAKS